MKRMIVISFFARFGKKASAPPPASPIVLTGTMLPPPGTERSPEYLIEVGRSATRVDLVFNANLGNMTLDVIDRRGDSAFLAKFHAVATGTLTIDTRGWENGEYILVIMDEQKDYLEGKFVITE